MFVGRENELEKGENEVNILYLFIPVKIKISHVSFSKTTIFSESRIFYNIFQAHVMKNRIKLTNSSRHYLITCCFFLVSHRNVNFSRSLLLQRYFVFKNLYCEIFISTILNSRQSCFDQNKIGKVYFTEQI